MNEDQKRRAETIARALDEAFEGGRRLGFEQGIAKSNEYRAATEQFDREARERRGLPALIGAVRDDAGRDAAREWAFDERGTAVRENWPELAAVLDRLSEASGTQPVSSRTEWSPF